jgi:transposase
LRVCLLKNGDNGGMKAYSPDLRERIVTAYQSGDYSQDEVAALFSVSQKAVSNYVRQQQETGSCAPREFRSGPPPRLDEAATEALRQHLAKRNDATLWELRDLVVQQCGVRVSLSVMCRTLQALGLPRKKKRCTLRSVRRSG